jgi:hypothetical protein
MVHMSSNRLSFPKRSFLGQIANTRVVMKMFSTPIESEQFAGGQQRVSVHLPPADSQTFKLGQHILISLEHWRRLFRAFPGDARETRPEPGLQ